MRKKISFVILGSIGAPAKQVCTTKSAISLFGAVLICFFVVVGYIVYDYYHLRETTSQLQNREVYLTSQMEEIRLQRKQIQEFATEINSLKAQLLALNGFGKKIRIIANIEESGDASNIFGVGGSIPEDLDPQMPLKEKHNSLMRDMHEQIEQLSRASGSQQEEFESLLRSLEDQQNLLILATADGVVTFAGKKGLYGNVIIIDNGHGMSTRFGHCAKLLKKRGEKVKRWETIALMGNTGRSTGPHVHYEVRLNGMPVNPEKYILN
jgi:septal ring factor EnvC (AmiA/AmiB activator)